MRHLRMVSVMEAVVAGFPQTYQIVRQGAVENVTVGSSEELATLRTELALMSSFATGATQAIVQALEARLADLRSASTEESRQTATDVEDMLGILRDAMNPATAEAVARIDAGFPQVRGDIDMAPVEMEGAAFHEDVGNHVAASGKPGAGRLSQAFKQALLKSAVAAKGAAQKETGSAEQTAPKIAPKIDPVEAALQQAVGAAQGSVAPQSRTAPGEAEEGVLEAAEAEEGIAEDVDGEDVLEEAVEPETLAEMAELAEQLGDGDPVEATRGEAADAARQADPIETILAEQAAAAGEAAPDAGVEQLLAGQEAGGQKEIPPEQLPDVLSAGQVDTAPAAKEVDDPIEKEWAEADQAADATARKPEEVSIEASLKYAGDQVEGGKANADSDTDMVPQDDAGRTDVAAEKVAEAISDGRSEIDAIASAFNEASSHLDEIEDEVSAVVAGEDGSPLPEAELIDAGGLIADLESLDEMHAPDGDKDPASAGTETPAALRDSTCDLPSRGLREELQAIRQSFQGGLERLIRLLDTVDRTHIEAENRLTRARSYQRAAQRSQEVSKRLVQAQTEAAEAKAAFESAQRRLDEAQSAWEESRRDVEDTEF